MPDDLKSNLAARIVSECPDIIRRLMLDLDMDGITLPGVAEEDGSESFEQRFSRSAHAYAEYLIETDLESFQSSDSAHFKASIRAPLLEDFYKIAVTKDWWNVRLIPEGERTDPILILAVKQSSEAIRHIPDDKESLLLDMLFLKSFVREMFNAIFHEKLSVSYPVLRKTCIFVLMPVLIPCLFIFSVVGRGFLFVLKKLTKKVD